MRLLKYLYGTAEAGDSWDIRITRFIKNVLHLTACTSDAALFYEKSSSGQLFGTLSKFVDDLLFVGNSKFLEHISTLKVTFTSKAPSPTPFTYSGMLIEKHNGCFYLSQQSYTRNILPLPEPATFNDFRSVRHHLAWLSYTRPQLTAPVNIMAQITESKFFKESIRKINKNYSKSQGTRN